MAPWVCRLTCTLGCLRQKAATTEGMRRVRHDLGSFYADPGLSKENRCDLHPRWSRDGTEVCIDSVHGEGRQMYIVDVGSIVSA